MPYSRFYLCDLHVHTPGDQQHRYEGVRSRDPNSEFARRLVGEHRARGVEVIAVTDHNRVDWYPVTRAAGDELGVAVFPGVEFSVNGCHLLAIWDRTEDGYALAGRFLAQLWKPGETAFAANGDPKPVTRGQVLEVAQEAIEHRALVFAPHSTLKSNGMFAKGVVHNSGDIARSGSIHGFDVHGHTGADVLRNPRCEFGDVPPRWFISGDVRAMGDVGERAVYLKLGSEPTLEGLRQAFLMTTTRVRFPVSLAPTWNHVQGIQFIGDPIPTWPRLTRLTVTGGFHDGLRVDFAPGLNAIIGGKGTGKSTLIEIVRHVLEADGSATEDARANRKHNFRANAEAQLEFIDDSGDAYAARRSGDEAPTRLLRADRDTGVAVGRRMSARIFGQRELQSLAERTEYLRDFVVSHAQPDWDARLGDERTVLNRLRTLDNEINSLEADVNRMGDSEEELADLRDRLKNAEDRGAADLLAASERLAATDASVRAVLAWPQRVDAAVDLLETVLPAPPSPVPVPDGEGATVPAGLANSNTALAGELARSVERLRKTSADTARDQAALSSSWTDAHSEQKRLLNAKLAEAGVTDPDELDRLQHRAADLELALRSLPEKRTRCDAIEQDRRAALQELGEVRRGKSRLVEEASRVLTANVGTRVRVVATPLADRGPLLQALEDALRGQGVRRDQLERIAQHPPTVVSEAIRSGTAAVERLGCTAGAAAKVVGLPPSSVRAIEETDVADRIDVEIDLGPQGAEAWTNVSEASPGQRATALLALVLASGREPLVIDQPEDDLDNRNIYEEVVTLLTRVCASRQVVVATHNANIPILGDAEMILALDAAANRSRVLACGGLEDAEVADQSRQILEGGDEAFRARQSRYEAAAPR